MQSGKKETQTMEQSTLTSALESIERIKNKNLWDQEKRNEKRNIKKKNVEVIWHGLMVLCIVFNQFINNADIGYSSFWAFIPYEEK